MASGSIVKHFDVIKDISSGQIACFVDTFSYSFFLQATKKRLGYRIIPTVSTPAHARFELVFATEPQPVATAGRIQCAYQYQQSLVLDGSIRRRLVQPRVETTTADVQNSAHRRHPIIMPMVVNKSVLYPGSLAKYRAAFLRISRSSSVRLN